MLNGILIIKNMKQYKEIKDGEVLRDDVIMDDVTAASLNSSAEHTGITYEPTTSDGEENPVEAPKPTKKKK
jgi:hypothetical protein